jgi:hypothetical protein
MLNHLTKNKVKVKDSKPIGDSLRLFFKLKE